MTASVAALQPLSGAVPTADEFIERARALVPVLRERSDRANQERSVPAETMEDFRKAGFFKMLQPKRYGGYEAGYDTFARILEELGQGCGSSAWVCLKLAEHPWFISYFSEQAQDEVWGPNPDARASASFAPRPIQTVPGGYRATATWSFSSGCDHAQWVYLGGMTEKGMIFMLVPMTDIEIVDDWHVFGLQGSGSKSLKLVDVFIPEHRTINAQATMTGDTPGAKAFPDNYLARSPNGALAPYSTPSVSIGLAQRALDHFVAAAPKDFIPGAGMAPEQQFLQVELSHLKAELDMVRTLKRERLRTAVEIYRAGDRIDALRQAEGRRDMSVFAHRLTQIVLRICAHSNPRWVRYDDPRQLILRDVIAASAHFGAHWSSVVPAGRELFGLPPVMGAL